jgi:transposase-like protein
VRKKGFFNDKQRYKCMACGRSFVGGLRIKSEDVLIEYLLGKQTYTQLAEKYNCSNKTIQRKIDQSSAQQNRTFPSPVNVLMDTTYFGKSFGVTVFKDSFEQEFIFRF